MNCMSETIRIRRARPEEAALLTELTIRSKAHWPYDAAFLAVVRHELEFQPSKYLPDFHVYVLEEKQTVLGFCGLIRVDDARMELRDLFLDPNYIGEGQGKRLWNFAVELARGLGFRTLILTADPLCRTFLSASGSRPDWREIFYRTSWQEASDSGIPPERVTSASHDPHRQ